MHLNISSLQYHLDELINESKTKFSVIDITESRLDKDIAPLKSLQHYNIQHTPTEYNKGGSLLCISTDLSYNTRNDLKCINQKNWNQFSLK